MNDLIDRQAAIDALGGNEPVGDPSKMDDDDVVKMWERIRIINIINKLPSAQSETHEKRTETHACDCISRQAAIDAIVNLAESHHENPDGDDCIMIILDVPSAQPEPSMEECACCVLSKTERMWIPCSERLSDKEVLCCDTRGEMIIGYPYQDEESNTGYSAVLDDVVMIDCTAWMPLPEPYTEDGREK